MTTTSIIRGRCLCGAVTFALTPPTDFCAHCHCESCRRATGGPYVTWTSVPQDRFSYGSGQEHVRWHRSSATIRWGFCDTCGSTLFYVADGQGHPENPRTDCIYVTVASLSDPLDRQPAVHVSAEEKPPWVQLGDHLPRYRAKSSQPVPTDKAWTILYVADQGRSRDFYAALLGQPALDVPGMTEFHLAGGASLGLMPEAGIENLLQGRVKIGGEGARAELYLRVGDPGALHRRALQAGATEVSPLAPRDWGDSVAYSLDPDGHVLALATNG